LPNLNRPTRGYRGINYQKDDLIKKEISASPTIGPNFCSKQKLIWFLGYPEPKNLIHARFPTTIATMVVNPKIINQFKFL